VGKTVYYIDKAGVITSVVDTLKTKDDFTSVCAALGQSTGGLSPCTELLASCILNNFGTECVKNLGLGTLFAESTAENNLPASYNLLVNLGFKAANGNIISVDDWMEKVMKPRGLKDAELTAEARKYLTSIVAAVNEDKSGFKETVMRKAGPVGSGAVDSLVAQLAKVYPGTVRHLALFGHQFPIKIGGGDQNGGGLSPVETFRKEYTLLQDFMDKKGLTFTSQTRTQFDEALKALTAAENTIKEFTSEQKGQLNNLAKVAQMVKYEAKDKDGKSLIVKENNNIKVDETAGAFENAIASYNNKIVVLNKGLNTAIAVIGQKLGNKNFSLSNFAKSARVVPGTATYQQLVPLTLNIRRA